MLKPPMPNVAGMTDTLDFVKNLWGSMNVPGVGGMGDPALSVDDLDKKISDLKAVESWLNLNANMLRATIQAMEVQRGTIATLKSMSESMAQAMGQPAGAPAGGAPAGGATASAASAGAPSAGSAPGGSAPGAGGTAPGSAPGADAMPAAMAWWNLLQEQFQQAVASTMPPASTTPGAAQEAKPAPAERDPAERGPAKPNAAGRGPSAPKGDKS